MADIKSFNGCYYVWRWGAQGLRRTVGGKPLPYKQHLTREAAQAEAERLSGLWPDSTFLILQAIGRVKASAAEQAT